MNGPIGLSCDGMRSGCPGCWGKCGIGRGACLGQMAGLGFALRAEASLHTRTTDVEQSSAIEGESLDAGEVRSSIARRLGMDTGGAGPASGMWRESWR